MPFVDWKPKNPDDENPIAAWVRGNPLALVLWRIVLNIILGWVAVFALLLPLSLAMAILEVPAHTATEARQFIGAILMFASLIASGAYTFSMYIDEDLEKS